VGGIEGVVSPVMAAAAVVGHVPVLLLAGASDEGATDEGLFLARGLAAEEDGVGGGAGTLDGEGHGSKFLTLT
jgi:hypothetical protein